MFTFFHTSFIFFVGIPGVNATSFVTVNNPKKRIYPIKNNFTIMWFVNL